MRISALLLFAALATVASAQTPRVERPFRLELGAYFPDYRGASFGNDLGVAASLGYAFARQGDVELIGSLRGATHIVTAGRGSGSFDGPEDNDLSVSSAFVDARYAPVGSRLFGGFGLGLGRARIDGFGSTAGVLLAVEGGIDLSRSVYVAVRYGLAGPDVFRGATASVGFRF